MEFQGFHGDVYLNSALRHRTTGILSPVESDFNVPMPQRVPAGADINLLHQTLDW